MKQLAALLLIAIVFTGCNKPSGEESNDNTALPSIALTLKWKTDTLLTTCESVLYDADDNVLFVSNIEGDPSIKDGLGSVARVSLEGAILDARWVTGLNAPKGMGRVGGMLYVADIDQVVEINIASGEVSNRYPVEGGQFLNDITTDSQGKVYVSDTNGGTIHVLDHGKISLVASNLDGPNGLLSDGDSFYVALWNAKTLNTLDLSTGELTQQADSIDNPDGVEAVGDGGHFVSSWNGMVHYVGANGETELILDTTQGEINAADIEYIPEKKLLLVPGFFKNFVMAYEVQM